MISFQNGYDSEGHGLSDAHTKIFLHRLVKDEVTGFKERVVRFLCGRIAIVDDAVLVLFPYRIKHRRSLFVLLSAEIKPEIMSGTFQSVEVI